MPAHPLAPRPTQRLEVAGDGVHLAVQCWGPMNAPPLLLVHGYPDNHAVWLPLIRELANEFRLIAYDVRGFGASARPKGRQAYRLSLLAHDLEAVIRAVSPNRPVHLLGHDWGSIQCWEAVTEQRLQPLIASFTSISGPCLDHMGFWLRERRKRGLGGLGKQLLSSWYVTFFHLPLLPELVWRLGLDRAWPWLRQRSEGIKTLPRNPTQRADGIHGIQLYRANIIPRLARPRWRETPVPVQLIVPLRDRYVRPWLFEGLSCWAPRLTRQTFDAGHWQLLDRPHALAERLRLFTTEVEPIHSS